MFMQPQENYLNNIHMAGTLSKGIAQFNLGEPFLLKEKAKDYFQKNLMGTKIYEISDIKSELETTITLKIKKQF